MPKDRLELPSPNAERLFDAEQLRELLQQVRALALGQIDARVDRPQFDLAFASPRINVGPHGMLAENGSHRPSYDLVAAVQDYARFRGHAGTDVAISLSVQKKTDRRLSHIQHTAKSTTFQLIETAAFFNAPTNERRQVIRQIREHIGLAKI